MRGAPLVLAALLAACGQGDQAAAPAGEAIQCSLGGAKDFTPHCQLERSVIEGAQVFIVRHPDGAFRRMQVSPDGQNLLAADGADETQSALKGDRYEVILGLDRYVIPAGTNAATR
ncbi:hypothetical protein [Novosphingobium sp.]|uniref:hypothetical protein n=1 Tax=Novosphingobium sp. TaxID=1874826 RepID=UPI00273562FB|nr:hypothetical protein [Novosphingobium sp.]MDP3905642.1 hypothetical protein [Novosphingobium sp.]